MSQPIHSQKNAISYFGKMIFAGFLPLTLASYAQGKPFVDFGLKVGAEVSANATKHHKSGSMECNPLGKSNKIETFTTGPFVVVDEKANGRVNSDEQKTYNVNVNYGSDHWINARTLKAKATFNQLNNGGQRVSVTLDDSHTKSHTGTSHGDCSNTNWHAIATKDSLNGSIRIGYKMPANTWAVKVVRHDGLGVLNTLNNDTPSRIVNALNAELDPAVSRSEFTVWAKPESDIYQEFLFNNANFGSEADGSFSIDFIPVGKGELTERQINDLKSQMSVILNGPSSVSSQLNPNNIFGAFTDTAISFINNPQGTKTIAAGLSTKEIYLLIDDLRKVAHSSDLSAGVWDARAAASILSFELSLLLLNDLGPYCSTMEVHLPYTDKTVNTLGLRMAHLYLARALSRVENYRFSQYREFLDQMSRYQNAGLSYSAVRTDPAKMQQMRDAYNILKAVAGDGITPFGAALTEVKFVLSKFKSIGAGQATTDEILTLLSGLSEVEDKFVQDFVLKLREFKSNNHNKVDVTDLKERVARIEREQQQVLHLMRHNVRFLSLGEGADTSSFVSMMQNLISNNVSIFRKPLQFAVFESIRAAYVNNESVNQTLKQAEQCIMENIP